MCLELLTTRLLMVRAVATTLAVAPTLAEMLRQVGLLALHSNQARLDSPSCMHAPWQSVTLVLLANSILWQTSPAYQLRPAWNTKTVYKLLSIHLV